jgi:hypothetical protein
MTLDSERCAKNNAVRRALKLGGFAENVETIVVPSLLCSLIFSLSSIVIVKSPYG